MAMQERIALESKALEAASAREDVETMAKEALFVRSQADKEATAAAAARIRAEIAAAEYSRNRMAAINKPQQSNILLSKTAIENPSSYRSKR